jgi:hypothetical protein
MVQSFDEHERSRRWITIPVQRLQVVPSFPRQPRGVDRTCDGPFTRAIKPSIVASAGAVGAVTPTMGHAESTREAALDRLSP